MRGDAMSQIVLGKEVFTTLEEWVRPEHTAVLVIDMQNDFCDVEGAGAKKGRDWRSADAIIPRLIGFLDNARVVGIPIIYCMNTQRSDALYLSSAEIGRRLKKSGGDPLLWTIDGTWGHQVVAPLAPRAADVIVRKHRPSGFHQTDLECVLGNLGIKSLILTGVGTRGCVESTARDAQSRDYYILIPEDTTASQRPEWYEAWIVLAHSLYHWIGLSIDIEAIWDRFATQTANTVRRK